MTKVKHRFLTLDAMRGVAALAVTIYHAPFIYQPAWSGSGNPPLFPSGFLAVDLFFCLSGFVLALSYDGRLAKDLNFFAFMKKRFVRLLPAYLIVLAAAAALSFKLALLGRSEATLFLVSLALNAVLLPTSSHPPFPPSWFVFNFPAWSLFLEVWVANLLYALIHRWLDARLLLAIIASSAALLIATVIAYGTLNTGGLGATQWSCLPRVLFSFFAGVALFRVSGRVELPPVPSWSILAMLFLMFAVPQGSLVSSVFELCAVLLIFPLLTIMATAAVERRRFIGEALGDLSYNVYLVHAPTMLIFIKLYGHGLRPGALTFLAYLVAIVMEAWLLEQVASPSARRAWLARMRRSPA